MTTEEVKGLAWVLVGSLFVFAILGGLGLAFLYGLVWVVSKLYPVAQALASLGTVLLIFMLLPSAIFKGSRIFCGNGIVLVSYLWGLSLWMWSFLLLYELWGLVGLFLGLILLPAAVPLACIALLLADQLTVIGLIIFSVIAIFSVRALGYWVISKGMPREPSYYYYRSR
jgi:hypothetical protein